MKCHGISKMASEMPRHYGYAVAREKMPPEILIVWPLPQCEMILTAIDVINVFLTVVFLVRSTTSML